MKFSDLKIGERFKGLGCVYLKIDDDRAWVLNSSIVISVDWDDEVEKLSQKLISLTTSQQSTLREMVWNAIESLQTDGEDRPDNPWFGYYCDLYLNLGGNPPAPQEPKLSETARHSANDQACDLMDIARRGGTQNG